ncbi:thiopeptide maturation pyridine synthase [Micromonospora sp. NPDC000207]|uniref:thiopeptide maturation pyridine synthase n=1 Tax=Micromonospora sp. NPDC000207 TaxID=3154246 RepID=UPI0033246A04
MTHIRPSQEDPGWYSIQIRYHAQEKDDLILDGVRPLLATLAEAVDRPHLLRHWRRGPHLRINLRTTPQLWAEVVRPTAHRHLTAYLDDKPSTAALREADHLAAHRRLAVREADPGPLTPWYPDNTIQFEPYEDRRHVLGSTALANLLADGYADSTALTFDTLAAVRSDGVDRVGHALDLMFAFGHLSVPPISRGYMSFRSHVESLLGYTADPDAVRSAFDERYDSHRPALRDRLHATEAVVAGTRPEPLVAAWLDIVRRQKALAEPLFTTGEIDLDHLDQQDMELRHRIEFHDVLRETPDHHREVLSQVWFRCHRLAINQLYSHLSRIGIVPTQRYLLCHLVARTVEEEYDISPVALARQFVADRR